MSAPDFAGTGYFTDAEIAASSPVILETKRDVPSDEKKIAEAKRFHAWFGINACPECNQTVFKFHDVGNNEYVARCSGTVATAPSKKSTTPSKTPQKSPKPACGWSISL
jgi:hypothetical protein